MICNPAEKEELGHSLNLRNVNLEILGQLAVRTETEKTLNNVFRFQSTLRLLKTTDTLPIKISHI